MDKNLNIKKIYINNINKTKINQKLRNYDIKLDLLKNRIEYLENEIIHYKKQNKKVNEEITDE